MSNAGMGEESPSLEVLRDLVDAQIITVGRPTYDPAYFDYFEDFEEYSKALVAIGKDPAVSIPHELAHGICSVIVGAIGVKYGIEYRNWSYNGQDHRIAYRAVASILGPSQIPRLGLAASAVAPKYPSKGDVANMKRLGYHSLEYLEERIVKWNRRDTGLLIPLPGTIEASF